MPWCLDVSCKYFHVIFNTNNQIIFPNIKCPLYKLILKYFLCQHDETNFFGNLLPAVEDQIFNAVFSIIKVLQYVCSDFIKPWNFYRMRLGAGRVVLFLTTTQHISL